MIVFFTLKQISQEVISVPQSNTEMWILNYVLPLFDYY